MAAIGFISTFLLLTTLTLIKVIRPVRSSPPIITYRVEEERPPYTFIGNVKDDWQLRAKHSDDVLRQLRFSLHQPSAAASEYLTIDAELGILRTKARIDRELLCLPLTPNCDTITVDIKVTPDKYLEIVKVKVKVADVNDRKPTFPVGRIEWPVQESALPGLTFPLPHADDADAGANGVQIYELATPSKIFDVQMTNQTDGTLDVALVLRGRLDYETQDFYRLVVNAWDGGKPPQHGTITVDIVVINNNDHHPVFGRDDYEARVYENAIPGAEVLRVHAVDADSGQMGEIVYSLSALTDAASSRLFRVDAKTGMIYLKDVLDYEQQREYMLNVVASDRGDKSLHTTVKVKIMVLDVNDNAPSIIINTLTESGLPEIDENVNVGTFVAHIHVHDPDAGQNSQFDCSIDSEHFILERRAEPPSASSQGSEAERQGGLGEGGGSSVVYTLVSNAIFDREIRDSYDVRMTCADLGEPQQTVHKKLKVKVTDENDNAPTFAERAYHIFYAENNVRGSFVVKMNASDADIGGNGAIRYEIQNVDASENLTLLDVDPVLGLVRAQTVFDFETRRVYEFRIIASDHGKPPKSSTVAMFLEILDQNDAKPAFIFAPGSNASYVFQVAENAGLNAYVGTVNATDADSYPYNQIVFAIDASVSDAGARDTFDVNSATGVIRTRGSLDREQVAEYKFVVVASNVGSPTVSSSTIVTVQVTDDNDNAPVVLFPSPADHTVLASSLTSVGSTVAQIRARDPDLGLNGTLVYRLMNPLPANVFEVVRDTGEVKVISDLSPHYQQTFTLQVAVRDGGLPPWESAAELTIVVNLTRAAAGGDSPLFGMHVLSARSELFVVAAVVAGLLLTLLLIALVVCVSRTRRHREKNSQRYNCRLGQEAHSRSCTSDGAGDTGGHRRHQNGHVTSVDVKYSKVLTAPDYPPAMTKDKNLDFELMQLAWHDDERGYTKIEVDRSALDEEKTALVDMNPGTMQMKTYVPVRQPSPQPCVCHSPIACQLSRDRLLKTTGETEVKRAGGQTGAADQDSESGCSACTDSGRGLSEEGDMCNSHLTVHRLNTSPGAQSLNNCGGQHADRPCDIIRCPVPVQACKYMSPPPPNLCCAAAPPGSVGNCWPLPPQIPSPLTLSSSHHPWTSPVSSPTGTCAYRPVPVSAMCGCVQQEAALMRTFTPPPLPSPAFVDWSTVVGTATNTSMKGNCCQQFSPQGSGTGSDAASVTATGKKKGVRFADATSAAAAAADSLRPSPLICSSQHPQQQVTPGDSRLHQWLHTNMSSMSPTTAVAANVNSSCDAQHQFYNGDFTCSVTKGKQTDSPLANVITDV